MFLKEIGVLILGLTAFMFGANVLVEYLTQGKLGVINPPGKQNAWNASLSEYLTGQYGWLQSLAYIGFSYAIYLMGIFLHSTHNTQLLFDVGAISLLVVVISSWLQQDFSGTVADSLGKLHVIAAYVVFGTVILAMILQTLGTWLLGVTLLAPVTAVLIKCFWSNIRAYLLPRFGNNNPPVINNVNAVIEKDMFAFLLLSFFIVVGHAMFQLKLL